MRLHLLSDAAIRRENNLDVLRLLAALMVLVSHCYPLLGVAYEPFAARLGGYDTGGGLAVSTFFIISGFLIARSAEKQNWMSYVRARVLRIVPGLAMVIILQYFLLGPFFTTYSLDDYFGLAIGHLSGLFVFDVQTHLPGVFNNLFNKAVNGSLWTIPIEVLFYMLTALFVAFGVLRKRTAIYLAGVAIISHLILLSLGYNWSRPGPTVFYNITAYNFTKLVAFYFIGAAAWFYREKIRLDFSIFIIFLLLLYVARVGIAKQLIYFVSLPYLVLFLGFYRYVKIGFYERIGDISYGTYLYAFPVQQMFVYFFKGEVTPLELAALAVPTTLLLAYFSWVFIEKPSLALKDKFNRDLLEN